MNTDASGMQLLPVANTIQSRGRLLDLSEPVVMGILNATPDSFYNKGRGSDTDALLRHAEKMLEEGATILDLGGVSTRPGQELMNADEELQRILPVVAAVAKRFPEAWLSVDTYNARVALETVQAGASIVNDISAGAFDSEMYATVAMLQVPYVAMHIQGIPATMQLHPQYQDVAREVRHQLTRICERCTKAGIRDVIIDPGFGFGKTVSHNFQLLNGMHSLRILGKPMLAGLSRKSIVCKPLGITPEAALNGTTALNMIALQQGAAILRVHDVREAVEAVRLSAYLKGSDRQG